MNTTIASFFFVSAPFFWSVRLAFPLSHDVAKSRKWKWDGDFCAAAARVASDHFFGAIIEWVEIASQRRWSGRNWIMETKLLYYLWLLGTASHPASSKANRARIIQLNRFPFDFASSPIQYFAASIHPPVPTFIQFHPNRKNFSCIIHDWLIFNSRSLFHSLSLVYRIQFDSRNWTTKKKTFFLLLLCVIFVWKLNSGKALELNSLAMLQHFVLNFLSEFDIFWIRLCKHHWRPRAIDVGRWAPDAT